MKNLTYRELYDHWTSKTVGCEFETKDCLCTNPINEKKKRKVNHSKEKRNLRCKMGNCPLPIIIIDEEGNMKYPPGFNDY